MQETQAWFHQWFNSPYYHLLYEHRDEREAQGFVEAILQHLHLPKGANVLDLACGKGRHAAHLAQHPLQVYGLDIAEESIAAAQQQYSLPNLRFAVHDMRLPLPFPPAHFHAVFNLFTSFGYFESEEEHIQTLQNIAQGLRPAGFFVLDFLNASKIIKQLKHKEVIDKSGIRFHIRRWVDESGYINKNIRFSIKGQHKEFDFTERVRAYNLDDFKHLFEKVNIKIIQTFGSYRLSPYQPDKANRLIVLGKKTI